MRQTVQRQKAQRHAKHIHRFAASVRWQPAEKHRKQHDQHQPDPKRRQTETQDRRRHDRLADESIRLEPRNQPQRNAQTHSNHHRGQGQFERRRHPRHDQFQRGNAVRKALAQIAGQRTKREAAVLRPNRFIEPQRHNRTLALRLIGLTADEDVNRVADQIYADEHQHAHDEQHEQRLSQAAE